MKNIKVKKEDLLKILEINRSKHIAQYELAKKGYNITLHKLIIEKLEKLSKNEEVDHFFGNLSKPSSYEKDYSIIIGMLSITEEDIIELSEQDYRSYYLDDWNWKSIFIGSNAGYIGIGNNSPTYSFEL